MGWSWESGSRFYFLDKEMGFENRVALLVWVVVACLGIWESGSRFQDGWV